ncbi:MAG: hypothetical protein AAB912_02225 [Patescibacteria group bacterium]
MVSDFPIWRSIALRWKKNEAEYRAAFKMEGYRISSDARHILVRTPIAKTMTTVDLVLLSVREMGLPNKATTREIYNWAEGVGLEKCPAEVGPALRMQYVKQEIDELIMVGMEPIERSDGRLYVFRVDGGSYTRKLWLGVDEAHPTKPWHDIWCWVFVRSKQ